MLGDDAHETSRQSIDINYLREHHSHHYLYEHRCGNSLSVVITVTRSFEVTSQPDFMISP